MFQNDVKNLYIGEVQNIMSICEMGGKVSFCDSILYKCVLVKEQKLVKGEIKEFYREVKTNRKYELNDGTYRDNVDLLTPVEEYYNQDGTKKISKRFKKESKRIYELVDSEYKRGRL